MLAKCSRCTQTFQTDRYGEQFCPFCGAAVMISGPGATPNADPAAPAAGGPIPQPQAPGSAATGPQDQAAPLDEPAAHGGWLNAAVETWKKSVFEPQGFFGRLRPGPDTGGALGYACVLLVVGGFFQGVMQFLQGMLQRGQLSEAYRQMSELPPEFRHFMTGILSFQTSPLWIVVTPVLAVVSFFINAAMLHVALMIVSGNKNGFTATLRAMGYAQGPAVFNIVPFCGGLAAAVWTLIMNVIGLSSLHRVGIGRVIGAYAVLIFGSCCLCILPLAGIAGYAASKASASHQVYDAP